MRTLVILVLLPAVLLLGAACSSDDDGDGGAAEPTTAADATEAPADATTEATAEPTEAPTEAPTEVPAAGPSFLAAANGVTCTGGWTNLTFGSTGSFDAVFAINEAGDAGTVTITLGGNVFGAAGGTVELPVTVDGDNVVVDAAADFLGNAKLTFNASGGVVDAVFEAPPAFGSATSKATLEDFAFDGTSLSTKVLIDFGDGASTAESEIESTCA